MESMESEIPKPEPKPTQASMKGAEARVSETAHTLESQEVLRILGASEAGLSTNEAKRRLDVHGPNRLPMAKEESWLILLWHQLKNPLIWVLLGAGVIAFFVDPEGGIKSGVVILGAVIINTLIGFIQEQRASRAIASLSQMVPDRAKTLRDGHEISIPAADLVPGDVVSLCSGDKVPADMRVLVSKNLQAQEAALTGESVPTKKSTPPVASDAALGDRSSMVFGGTLITYGTARAVVTATGAGTELGQISDLLNRTTEIETPLTKALVSIGKILSIAIIIVAFVLLILGTWRITSATGVDTLTGLRQTAIFAIALAVGAIPEGLPAIVTIILAIGVQRMARRRAIIRHLPAVETLGSTTVICSDKTGTLTRNEMTVQAIWTPDGLTRVSGIGYEPKGDFTFEPHSAGTSRADDSSHVMRLLEAGSLCNDAWIEAKGDRWKLHGDPTEGALVVAAEKAGIDVKGLRTRCPRIDVMPFESEHQFMATLHDAPSGEATAGEPQSGQRRLIMKGAPEAVLKRCSFEGGNRESAKDESAHAEAMKAATKAVTTLANEGMRVLAVAEKKHGTAHTTHAELGPEDLDSGFELLGLQGMIDPPRVEAIHAIDVCQSAGITVKMITGDHRDTAQAIGQSLGLASTGTTGLTGKDLESLSDRELHKAVIESNIFARVAPEHKLRLVRALQAQGHVVAMTGDGVNDAPALKQADIGVAMGLGGTAAARDASDIILMDDNFSTIEAAVEEGRQVYDNMVKSLAFVLPTNLGLALTMIIAVMLFPFENGILLVPMLPTQLLWINLVASVALSLPLAFEAKEPNIMERPPRDPGQPVFGSFLVIRTAIVASLMAAGSLAVFQYEFSRMISAGIPKSEALPVAQTMAVTTIVMFQIFYMLNCRSLRDSMFRIGFFSNLSVYFGIASLLFLQALFIYTAPLQNLFGTAPLGLREWLIASLVGAVILPVISIEKRILKQTGSRKDRAPEPSQATRRQPP
jgi:magnesium-transporting ATPase (P-type)